MGTTSPWRPLYHWTWLQEQLEEIFSQYGTHENLTTVRLAMELQRRIDLLESGKSDIPPMSET